MKDEEMAEEKGNEYIPLQKQNVYARLQRKGYKDGFLAGLKAGRPQWHDLEKDPDDLPNEPNEKMRVNETWAYVKFFDNTYGLVDKGALKNYKGAIAWCELPTFDKE